MALGLHQIGKLRHDANLRWLYRGEQKRRGRKRRYDGKVSFEDVSQWTLAGNINETQVYTAIVNSAHFKRDLQVVYLVKRLGNEEPSIVAPPALQAKYERDHTAPLLL